MLGETRYLLVNPENGRPNHWEQGDLALRLSSLLVGDQKPFIPYPAGIGSTPEPDYWTLDPGNNWHLQFLGNNEISLRYRYAAGLGDAAFWQALQLVICKLLRLTPAPAESAPAEKTGA